MAVIIGGLSCSGNTETSGQSSASSSGSNVTLIEQSDGEDFAGTWELKEGSSSGLEAKTLDALRAEGYTFLMTLEADGTGEFDMMGSTSSVTWEATGATEGTISFGAEPMTMSLKNDTLTIVNSSDETLTFVPEGTLSPSASGASSPSGSGGSGTSTSSASASSPNSSSSTTTSAATGKTAEYKSERGFAFMLDTGFSAHDESSCVRVYTGKDGLLPWFTITPYKKTGSNPAETMLQSVGEKAIEDYKDSFVVEPTTKKVKLSDGRVVKGIEYAYQKSGDAKATQVLTYIDELDGNAMANGFMYAYSAVCHIDDTDTPAAMQLAMDTFHFLAT